ncbi:MAG: HD domain-containing protein [Candidatus Obscuribacterales bacterium]|nr:HD domain-containing protein [Candidatus Obscuribacterales bacterium]
MKAAHTYVAGPDLDLVMISAAIQFAADKHRKQRRKDRAQTPYINHPLQVFDLLLRIGGIRDTYILVAAILHDTIEDTDTTADEIRDLFGEIVLGYVLELSDDKTLSQADRKRLQVEHASHKSYGAKLIKTGDKISNTGELDTNPPMGWDIARRLGYIDWAEQVIAGLRGTNSALEAHFDARIAAVRLAIAAEQLPA